MAAKPEKMPTEVVEAIKVFCKQHDLNPVVMLSPDNLKWDGLMGCYFFMRGDVYHGVEMNGYIHT